MKRSKLKALKRYWLLYAMLVPGIFYLIVNNYLPLFGLVIAFKKVNFSVGIWESPWNGLENFTFLLNKDGWMMVRNTLLYNLVFILLGNLVSLITAIVMDEVKNRFFRRFGQIVILIPHLLSYVILSYITLAFLSPSSGFINKSILEPLGLAGMEWYTDPGPWPFILTFVYLWISFGYSSILYYSTLIGIDKGLYEAAVIDGAGVWQQVKNITLPGMKHTVITMVLLGLGRVFFSDFGLFYQIPMNSGMLFPATQTIDTYVYRALLEQNSFSRSAAAGFLQSVLGFLLVLAANRIVQKLDNDSALF